MELHCTTAYSVRMILIIVCALGNISQSADELRAERQRVSLSRLQECIIYCCWGSGCDMLIHSMDIIIANPINQLLYGWMQ